MRTLRVSKRIHARCNLLYQHSPTQSPGSATWPLRAPILFCQMFKSISDKVFIAFPSIPSLRRWTKRKQSLFFVFLAMHRLKWLKSTWRLKLMNWLWGFRRQTIEMLSPPILMTTTMAPISKMRHWHRAFEHKTALNLMASLATDYTFVSRWNYSIYACKSAHTISTK